jgi:hypothetical protein
MGRSFDGERAADSLSPLNHGNGDIFDSMAAPRFNLHGSEATEANHAP